jgi:molybdopterin-containing oxidoreductase family membrane subunit
MKAIYGLYPEAALAQQAVDALRAAGLPEREITIITGEPIEEFEFAHRDKASWLFYIASAGGMFGLAFSTWLTTMTEQAWPLPTSGMPIVSWWPNLIIMFEMTMLGGILATVVSLFITAKIPGREPTLYDPEVTNGKILVGVEHPSEQVRARLETALRVSAEAEIKTV